MTKDNEKIDSYKGMATLSYSLTKTQRHSHDSADGSWECL